MQYKTNPSASKHSFAQIRHRMGSNFDNHEWVISDIFKEGHFIWETAV